MDEDRLKRYWDKINLILKRSDEITEWTTIPLTDFTADEKTKLATYKAFQEIAEACMDIVAMMCKDLRIPPKDDYANIEILKKQLSLENLESLTEANGLRNRLSHRYNATDDSLAFESIKEILPRIATFVRGIKKWLKDIKRMKKDFKFLSGEVLAVVVYGSRAKNEETKRSDTDICIVAPGADASKIYKETLHPDYDIKIFELMPLFMKIKVIKNHKIIYTRDVLDFYEYLYFFRKLWKDQEHRQRITREEALHIFGPEETEKGVVPYKRT